MPHHVQHAIANQQVVSPKIRCFKGSGPMVRAENYSARCFLQLIEHQDCFLNDHYQQKRLQQVFIAAARKDASAPGR